MTRQEVIEYCNQRNIKTKQIDILINGYDYIIDNLAIIRFNVDKALKSIEQQLPEYISVVCLLTLYGKERKRVKYKKCFVERQRFTEEELPIMKDVYGEDFTGFEYDITTNIDGYISEDTTFKHLLSEYTGKYNARYSDKELYQIGEWEDLFTVRHELQAYYNRFLERVIADILYEDKKLNCKDYILLNLLTSFTFSNIREYSDVRYLYYVDNIIEINDYANKTIEELFNEIEPYREMLIERFLGEYADQSFIYITKMFTPNDLVYYKKRYDEQKQVNELQKLIRKDIEELKEKGEWVGP